MTKGEKEIIDFILTQTGVDLNKYRDSATRRFDTKTRFNVDWGMMSEPDKRKVRNLYHKYPHKFTMELCGVWLMTFTKGE